MCTNTGTWWERFFSGDNQLQWSSLISQKDDWSEQVLPWVSFAQSDNMDLPIIFPRLSANGRLSWYCASRSLRGALRLREALQAFIGCSYPGFNGRPYSLKENDPIEAAFAEGTIAPTYCICPPVRYVKRIRRMLELYRGILERMPAPSQLKQRPLGSMRAALKRAVDAGHEDKAARLLERIRTVGRLDAENLLYLKIGVLAGLGHWHKIAEDEVLLDQLTGLRLPARVLVDVHEALYRVHIEPSEEINDPQQALIAFKSAGLMRRTTLFGMRREICEPRVLKAFFLYAVAREEIVQPNLISELTQLDDAFAHALIRLKPDSVAPQPVDLLSAADAAFDDFEIDRALELCLQAPPSRRRLTRLIRCARDSKNKAVVQRVIDAIEPGDGANRLPAIWQDRLRALRENVAAASY
ncbi:hypothetical protein ACQZV8_02510 [Magnetococcales bacterium HHB-1]